MRLVIVEWEDSMSGNSWNSKERLLVDKLPRIHSVGWILERKASHIHLVAQTMVGGDMHSSDLMIPTFAIRKITYAGKKHDKQEEKRARGNGKS